MDKIFRSPCRNQRDKKLNQIKIRKNISATSNLVTNRRKIKIKTRYFVRI